MNRVRLAVLASGSGSNFDAIADYFELQGELAAVDVVLLVSNRQAAAVLQKAAKRGIATAHLAVASDAAELAAILNQYDVNLVALAGYLQLVPRAVVQSFEGRILNVHPAVLPQFGGAGMYGLRVHQAVIASGAQVTGVTVHLVSEEYDRGAILAQWPVRVLPGETPQSLAKRVLAVEHVLYPRVIDAVARGTVRADRPFLMPAEEMMSLQKRMEDE